MSIINPKIIGEIVFDSDNPELECLGLTPEALNILSKSAKIVIPNNAYLGFVWKAPEGAVPSKDYEGLTWLVSDNKGFDYRKEFINGGYRNTYPPFFTKWVKGDSNSYIEDGFTILDGRDASLPDLKKLFTSGSNNGYSQFIVMFTGYVSF
jgi:hypothetical protein